MMSVSPVFSKLAPHIPRCSISSNCGICI
jgi:hypothetical protein